jgi:Thioredoxin domain
MIRRIQILGTKCSNTKEIAHRVEVAAEQLGLEYDIEHVTDVRRIMCFGPRLTPALCIDGDIRSAGETPTVKELVGILDAPTQHRALSTPVKSKVESETAGSAKSTA